MAGKHGSADLTVLVGGYNATGVTTSVTESHEGLFEDTTPFGVTDATSAYVGVKRGSFTQAGFYDDTALSINDELVNTLGGSDQVTNLLLSGNTLGAPFIGYKGLLTAKYDRSPAVTKLTRATGTFQVDGIVEDLNTNTILWPLGTASSASGTGTAVNNTAGTAAGGSGYLQCTALALGNRTNLVVTIQHSTDNSTWVDLIVFTALTSGTHAERLTVAGTVNQYTKAIYSWTGGSSGQSATIFVGFVRN